MERHIAIAVGWMPEYGYSYEGVCKEESSLSSIPFFSVILVLSFLAYERRWSDLIKK